METAVLPEPTLPEFTRRERKAPAIAWYRSPVPPAELKALHKRSNVKGAVQTFGYLAIMAGLFAMAVYASRHLPWWATLIFVFFYGTVTSFSINAVHELGHGTVFQYKWLNRFFTGFFAFLGWHNFEMFESSHVRHHRYTLHAPDDLEVTLPVRLLLRNALLTGIVNPIAVPAILKYFWRYARGRFEGEWEMTLFPPDEPEKAAPSTRWARIVLAGHALIAAVSFAFGWWIVPVLVSGGPFIGNWLFFLCNNTQHIGLQDAVPDFRLCCRTFRLNPIVRFIYWQMNYHTEHHMYAAVPCYNLGKLHAAIRHDLPPCADGLVAVWREIAYIQARHRTEPTYVHHPLQPGAPRGDQLAAAGA